MTDELDRSPAAGSELTPDGRRAVTAPRSDGEPEWELFLCESPTEPLRHAGSVTAPSAEAAHERAMGLFPEATTLWCCPADEMARFTERDLGSDYREADEEGAADTRPTTREVR